MARTYVNYKNVRNILMNMLGECDSSKLSFDNDYKVFEETPALRVACRLVRAVAHDAIKLDNILRREGGARFKYKALMMPGPDAETVRVFTNLPVDKWDNDNELKVCSPYMYGPVVLKTLAETIMADLGDARKSKAWEGTRRCISRLKRSEVMPVARALTRYTNIQEEMGWRDDQIRNLADMVVEQRKPMELIYADEPHQFVDMYSSGPESCMSAIPGKPFEFLYDDHDSHPTAFFAFHPYTRGVYVKKRTRDGVKVVARCILYQQEDGKWYYGRIYTTGSQSIYDKFVSNLNDAGIEELRTAFRRDVTFTIPGYRMDNDVEDEDDYEIGAAGDYAMPVPYFDNLSGRIRATWDKKAKAFTVDFAGTRRSDSNVDMTSTAGFTTSRRISVEECACCGSRIRYDDEQYIHQSNGNMYCSTTCVRNSGYIYALRSDGRGIVCDRTDAAIEDMLERNTWYTNREAAERLGAVAASSGVFIRSEEDGVSRHGYRMYMMDGSVLRVPYNVISQLVSHNRARSSGQMTTDHRLLRDMEFNGQTVSAFTFNSEDPVVEDANQMAIPAKFLNVPSISETFAINTQGCIDEWGSSEDSFQFFMQSITLIRDVA